MKNILFYYPSNPRAVTLETKFLELKKRGYNIIFLSTCERGNLHEKMEELGIPAYAHPLPKSRAAAYYLNQARFLISFCKKHKIDIVFSHLQHVNFIAAFAQYFIRARVVFFRHHFKFIKDVHGIPLEVNKMEQNFDKVINRLADHIVVPSSGVYKGMRDYENVDMSKVETIPYIYDFSKYGKPDLARVEEIKKEHPAQLRLIMVARLIPFKRHSIIFPIIKKLKEEGLNIVMFVLDKGPEKEKLEAYIEEYSLQENIIMLGFRRDFLDYMKAADMLIHPSLTEASNSVVKEMALMEKLVAVCQGVGDFDDYIEHEKNGLLLSREGFDAEVEVIIRQAYNDKRFLQKMGQNLKKTVTDSFGVPDKIIDRYVEIIESR